MINQENYSDSQGRQFVLTEQKIINGETWVFYQRLDRPDLTYSCLAEAFRERFFRFP